MINDADQHEILEGLQKIEEIVSGTLRDAQGTDSADQNDPEVMLRRIAVLTGRLIAVSRPKREHCCRQH